MKHFSSLLRFWPVATLLMLVLLARPAAYAQTPAWTQLSTGIPVTSGAFSYVQASAADAVGNVYLSGYFYGSVSFGTTTLISNATNGPTVTDGFVAKWNSATGTFVWAMALGGAGAMLAVSNSSVYLGGYFSGPTATFGTISLTNMTTAGNSDAFVAKLTDAGATASFVWAQSAGGTGADTATGLAVSGSSVYLTGLYGSATFTAGNTVLTNAGVGTTDMFVAKLTDAGTTASFGWALSFGGSGADEARALAVSGSSIYLLGDFTSPILSLGAIGLANAGSASSTSDMFMAKLTDTGTTASVVWAQRAGSTASDTGDAIALNGSNLYVTGSFAAATALVGGISVINASNTAGTADVFVAKFTDAGSSVSVAWAQAGGGTGSDRPRAVAVLGANVYVGGSYSYPSATFGTTTLINRGTTTANDIFVVKLADSGSSANFAWAQSAGGVNGESATSLAFTGNLVVASGGAAVLATFGPFTVPVGSTTTVAFVATIFDATLTAAAAAQGGLSFTLYPNPAHTTATVQLPAQPGTPTVTLTLLDALGRRVKTETVVLPATGLHHELNVAGLPAGLYALQVQAGAATATRKLVVE